MEPGGGQPLRSRPARAKGKRPRPSVRLAGDPLWYKDAIIYEVRVRSFYDANGDGTGDLRGLAEKLDYLQDLGVTALWLLPFYPSPQRDDGYDISDYTDVHREVGTLADFQHFLAEAHRRGLRVITELVLNHTSDQHPWFQRARKAPPGSPARDFYVWSDTPRRYEQARIIFKDFEHSNWTWDAVAKAYYWHRFYSHQPDLNFENPEVHKALLGVVDFWFKMGVDGMRLDAVPYLYEEEGTNCENLPATHAFLQKLRKHVDARFPGRMLLAEANQWPEDAVAYFGHGDECHMAFHFPIMPRLFMAIHMEDRFPLIDILAQTPPIPPACQWALFLRNHDELTLEMVTDEERDYMVRAYAHDPVMRINLGIRRRLAPLMGGDRRNMELMKGLLFSLPGTPVVYYGDEIGMGDNVYLGDRNGVRTPMQWSADRNAGFSRANPQRLVLPVIIDPEYHFESINVEAQQNNPSSLLWWMKRLIALRKRYKAFGRGTIELSSPENASILAFTRHYEDEVILVVANLSRFTQCVRLDLSKHKGLVPVELFGRTEFPPVDEQPYFLTLGGHAFYWFSLERPRGADVDARAAAFQPPAIAIGDVRDGLLSDRAREVLAKALPGWLRSRHWFTARGRSIAEAPVVEALPLSTDPAVELAIVEVRYANAPSETYVLPLALALGDRAATVRRTAPHSVLAHVQAPDGAEGAGGALFDAIAETEASRALLAAVLRRRRQKAASGFVAASAPQLAAAIASDRELGEVRVLEAQSGNPVIVLGRELVLKLFRKLDEGTSPDLEIGRFLTARGVPHTAAVLGHLEHRPESGEPRTIAVLKRFVENEGTAWRFAIEELGRYYERVLTRGRDHTVIAPPSGSAAALAGERPEPAIAEAIGNYLELARLLGRRAAELHLALASDFEDPAFAPEPASVFDQRSLYQNMRNLTGKTLRALRLASSRLRDEAAADAAALVAEEDRLLELFQATFKRKIGFVRVRTHGNLGLRQVLFTGKDFAIVDFAGDTSRPLSERRRKRSPLHDVATMVGSFAQAAFTALAEGGVVRDADRAAAEPWAETWHVWTGAAFLSGYLDAAGAAPFVPADRGAFATFVDALVLEEALLAVANALETDSPSLPFALRALRSLLRTR